MDDEGDLGEDPDRSIQALVSSLKLDSRLKRIDVSNDTIELRTPEGARIWCIRLTNSNDPLIHVVQKLFLKSFSTEEHDPLRDLKETVQDQECLVYALFDFTGNLVGAISSGYFELPSCNRAECGRNEAILFVDNVAIDPAWRGKGFAKELYLIVCESAQRKARMKGQIIRAVLGEVKNEVEDFWNKLGWRRIYFHDGNNMPREIPYIQPPLSWDWNTGASRSGHVSNPQHLMAWIADEDRNPLTVSELLSMIETIYWDNFLPSRERFGSKKAYRACCSIMEQFLEEMRKILGEAGTPRLTLTTRTGRERLNIAP